MLVRANGVLCQRLPALCPTLQTNRDGSVALQKHECPLAPTDFPALSTAEELNDACSVGGAGRLCRANGQIGRVIFLVDSKPTNRAEAVGSRRVRPELDSSARASAPPSSRSRSRAA
jgi:hypothetical protein